MRYGVLFLFLAFVGGVSVSSSDDRDMGRALCDPTYRISNPRHAGGGLRLAFAGLFRQTSLVQFRSLPNTLVPAGSAPKNKAVMVLWSKNRVNRKQRRQLRRERRGLLRERTKLLAEFRASDAARDVRQAQSIQDCILKVKLHEEQINALARQVYDLSIRANQLFVKAGANKQLRKIKRALRSFRKLGYRVVWEEKFEIAHKGIGSDVQDLMIVAHASQLGDLYDGTDERVPLGFLQSFGHQLGRLTLYSCHNQAVIERQGLIELGRRVEVNVVEVTLEWRDRFRGTVPLASLKAFKQVALSPMKSSHLEPKACELSFSPGQLNPRQGVYVNGEWVGTLKAGIPISCDQEIRYVEISGDSKAPGVTEVAIRNGQTKSFKLQSQYGSAGHQVSAVRITP